MAVARAGRTAGRDARSITGSTGAVWVPTPLADGTEIGASADADFIAISTNDEYAIASPALKKNAFWTTNAGTKEIVLRTMREPAGVSHPRQPTGSHVNGPSFTGSQLRYSSGAFIATFNYGTNWPPTSTTAGTGTTFASFDGPHPAVKRSWGLGHRCECDILAPAKDGLYYCFWMMTTNKDNGPPQGVIEIDWAENTPNATANTTPTNLRTTHFTARHFYVPPTGETSPVQGRTTGLPDTTSNWSNIAVEWDATPSVRFYFNDVLVRTTSGPKNSDGSTQTDAQLGLMINAMIGYPANHFRNGYETPFPADCNTAGQPAANWDLRIKNLKVTAL
jgi:hypothetical protein